MLSATVWLIFSSMLYTLRIGSGGSLPKPLSAAEERHYLELAAGGDLEARNILIEQNLRLVAHIMKKGYLPRKLFRQATGETRFDDYSWHPVIVWTVRM